MDAGWRVLVAVVAAVAIGVAAQLVDTAFDVQLSWPRTIGTAIVVALFLALTIKPRRSDGFVVD